jgi:alpha-L-fucosidase 2
MSPPWDSKYTININTEMNYWPAEPANLGECVQPLVEMVRDLSESGAHTAKVHWGAGGWVCHHNTDLWRASAPIDGPTWGFWPTGGAWLSLHLWEHYER